MYQPPKMFNVVDVKVDKRQRGRNYVEEEKEILLDLVEVYKDIIENKKTDSVTIEKKRRIWADITVKFNEKATTGVRTDEQLKSLYDNLKRKVRKDLLKDRRSDMSTTDLFTTKNNVNHSSPTKYDSYREKVLKMLGDETSSNEKGALHVYDANIQIKQEVAENAPPDQMEAEAGLGALSTSTSEPGCSWQGISDRESVSDKESNLPTVTTTHTSDKKTPRRKKIARSNFLSRKQNIELGILRARLRRELLTNEKLKLDIKEKRFDVAIKQRQYKHLC